MRHPWCRLAGSQPSTSSHLDEEKQTSVGPFQHDVSLTWSKNTFTCLSNNEVEVTVIFSKIDFLAASTVPKLQVIECNWDPIPTKALLILCFSENEATYGLFW